MFFSLSCYNALNSQFSLHSPSLVYADTHGSLVSANFATNWGEPIRESTANRFARTNSRFASQPANYVTMNGTPRTPDTVVDETWFSNLELLWEQKMWYQFAKVSAEEAATKFLTENDIDYVVMNPAVTIGPLLQPELNGSSSLIFDLINGSQTFLNATFGWINVKDVANAHIHAYEDASASGRYCLAERVAHISELAIILRDMYPTLRIPDKCAGDKPLMQTFQISKEKAKTLGIEFIPLEVSLREIVESFKEKEFANFQ